jgi:hypothetical protein
MTSAAPKCIECGARAVLTTGAEIYPRRYDLRKKHFYKCPKCPSSYCGCHQGTSVPLGQPCGPATRGARKMVHSILDQIWKKAGYSAARGEVYAALSTHMKLKRSETHVALFDIDKCRKAYRFLLNFKLDDEFEVIEK